MKKIKQRLLYVISVLVLAVSVTGCMKDLEPIVLTGTWELDTAAVVVRIIYNPSVAAEHPETIKFLEDNITRIRRELMKPNRIVFKLPNIIESYYNDVPLPVMGTFIQEGAYFTMKNPLFPTGIAGASDNIRLEFYYDREYLMYILYNLLTENDGPPSVYDRLIDSYYGVGLYKKIN
jgi:hypothetical protein